MSDYHDKLSRLDLAVMAETEVHPYRALAREALILRDENVRLEEALRAFVIKWGAQYEADTERLRRVLEQIAETAGAPAGWDVTGPAMAQIAQKALDSEPLPFRIDPAAYETWKKQ